MSKLKAIFIDRDGVINTEKHNSSDNCECRKPKSGMIESIRSKFDINIEETWFVGDKDIDILCGNNAGIKNTIQVRSGHLFDENQSKSKVIVPSIKNIKEII